MVSKYTGLNFSDCLELDCYTFKKLLINAFITKMRQSSDGRDYLETCWLLTQTETDTASMRRLFGKNKK